MEQMEKDLLKSIADISGFMPGSAFNLRKNGEGVERHSTPNVKIVTKEDKPGIDIIVKAYTSGESVHIPVILTESGINDMVYNDFYIEEGADVEIIAGCGIHNDGCDTSQHDGIHTFHIGKNAKVKYVEKHYGEGSGSGERILNPVTIIDMEEGSFAQMDMSQIKGVDSTMRKTEANLGPGAKLVINEKLMTHGHQQAHSDVTVNLNGEDSVVQIVSRSVGKDTSIQVFHPIAVGNNRSRAHIQCDSIIMDQAKISSIPEIAANHVDAQIIHEAAIGKINSDQLIKLQTLGLTSDEAEKEIVDGFLK
ncbi:MULTISPECIES: SufB/SufD family protein [Bacillota]|jgi:Fe-S cluster assembly scaffold protein SufB|uniref:SufD family Fe-S cluster assembly protein n=1 Tax=Amedibacillus hominis TaxID=2897776 RepID=A0ABS9R5H7_9FIRM|nr:MULTISPECIES: SufD family Fe-S cluster assembly protein [Bacillota]MCH4284899.1 SufD family Fe-S cluster assembly protein [Amedibacillus hominis]RGB55120.1 SufD family Fe-S cluster assembly protein [Absiella sp. AM22-9]RGB62709.1 SufD family Fe-S cluster assembly protein [Absiella sp. AM10-20]RGB69476.1 SufD family Fe-S cluster assembly protein [Absiella sp. AM09-45]RGB77756.1 SufD family Fe-S cluster assembly protein [Absiella sp. AM09-50]